MVGTCIHCGNNFKTRPCLTEKMSTRRQKYCSKKCLDDHKRGVPWSENRINAQIKKNGYLKKIIISCKEYDHNWHEIRKEIYKRDNWTCQECGKKCVDKKGNPVRRIQCHHIDYEPLNCKEDNLITLCASCHSKTNFRRTDWTNYFTKLRKN